MLKDNFLRVIDYMRISITDRCNLRCIYCMPADGVFPCGHKDILRYEEIIRVVRIAAGLGVRKIRLTGGEPLTRKNVVFLISSLKAVMGIEDLSMTTNGVLLEKYSDEIASAGLDRVNISLDSFLPERYREITRTGELQTVLRGISAAEKAGLLPIKINMVPMKGINDAEIEAFARLTIDSDYQVRFIELMPSACIDFWSPERYIEAEQIREKIEDLGPLEPVRPRKKGPSRYFRLKGARGVVGFISALSHHFCEDCNRLRLTADGKLRPCLFSESEIDLKSPLRNGAPDSEIARLLRLAVQVKPEGHHFRNLSPDALLSAKSRKMAGSPTSSTGSSGNRPMSKIGG
ncbi:MAG: GTP 3',8-cyclase MoaA [Candidatus Sulfobium sp.]|jgi:cyclic pyranopterin phosphate synthase